MSLWPILKSTLNEWLEDRASRLAAAVAYYAIFSIAPLLMIALSFSSLLFGKKAANDQLRPQLTQYLGEKAADFIQQLLAKVAFSPSLSFASIISLLLLLYAATNLFVSLQDALNTIFDVKPKPNRGIIGIIKDRALSFLMILLIGGFILASILFSTAISALGSHLPGNPLLHSAFLYVGGFLLSTFLFTVVFAAMFKILPDIKIAWRDTLIGAALTSLIFNLARIGLSLYLGRSSTAGPFGAAGSLVLIMLFINYSAQILFLGAEFTQIWARRNGHPIQPSQNALSLDPGCAEPITDGVNGAGSPTAALGANGSRRHDNSTKNAPRAPTAPYRTPSGTPKRSAQNRTKASQNTPEMHSPPRILTSKEGSLNDTKITQINISDISPHYPPGKFHPPLAQRRKHYVELTSAAALVAIPLALLTLRRGK